MHASRRIEFCKSGDSEEFFRKPRIIAREAKDFDRNETAPDKINGSAKPNKRTSVATSETNGNRNKRMPFSCDAEAASLNHPGKNTQRLWECAPLIKART